MHAHDVGAPHDADHHRRGGALHALIGRQVEGVADEGFSGGAEQDGKAQGADLIQAADELEVLLDGLAEADAGVEHDAIGGDAGTDQCRRALAQERDARQQEREEEREREEKENRPLLGGVGDPLDIASGTTLGVCPDAAR